MGYQFMGFEIDKDYCDKAQARLEKAMAQVRMDVTGTQSAEQIALTEGI